MIRRGWAYFALSIGFCIGSVYGSTVHLWVSR